MEVLLSLNLGYDFLEKGLGRFSLKLSIGTVGIVAVEDGTDVRGGRHSRQPHASTTLHMHLHSAVSRDERVETESAVGQVSIARDCYSAAFM